MSSLTLCDGEDCCNSENDCKIYYITSEMEDRINALHISRWFDYTRDDLCKECVDQSNIDYPGLFIVDKHNKLSISDKYVYNREKGDIEFKKDNN